MEKKKQTATKTTETKPADWSTLKGKFFHAFDEEGYVKYQGQIIDLVGEEIVIILLFEWFTGSPTLHKAMWISDIVDDGWALYNSDEEMREAYDIKLVKTKIKD